MTIQWFHMKTLKLIHERNPAGWAKLGTIEGEQICRKIVER